MGKQTIALGPFDLHEVIGRGGMSEVWRGVHREQGLPVAIKVMSPELADRRTARLSLEAEIRAVASLDHPGVVLVFDSGRIPRSTRAASGGRLEADSPWLAMELASGSLAQRRDGLGWSELQGLLLQLLDALAHAHARGVIHRDIKPGNVLEGSALPGREGYKLTDFGLAHPMERGAARQVGGTLQYMAPEQFRGDWRDFGPWTDLYSFGCLAWELASGRPPFAGGDLSTLRAAHCSRTPGPLVPLAPVPPGFEAWLHRLLLKHPLDRFQRAADAACALRALGDAPEGPATGERAPPPPAETVALCPAATWSEDSLAVSASPPPPRAPPPELEPIPLPPMPRDWRLPPVSPGIQLAGVGLGVYGFRAVRMVGREAARQRLWEILRAVREDRRARVVALTGPAGVGKSRLARWLCERAHELGAGTVLRARYSPERAVGDGLGAALARHLRCDGLGGPALEARLERVAREIGEVDPSFWRALIAVLSPASSESRRQPAEHFAVLGRFLSASARRPDGRVRPRILWVDDVQWGGEALGFTRHLLNTREDQPTLVLLTARDEALVERPAEAVMLGALLQLDGAEGLRVEPLDPTERRALVEELLGLEGPLAAQVADRCAGNPLFAIQLVGDWVQRGVLEPRKSGFGLAAGEQVVLPDDLHTIWRARVKRLLAEQPEGSGRALEIAAALGLTVDFEAWQVACQAAGVEVAPGLVDLLLRSRLAHITPEGWCFVHEMLRASIARHALEAGRAPRWHRACAQTLSALYPREMPGLAERVGGHWDRAGEPGRAVDLLLHAAFQRKASYELDRARSLLRRREVLMAAAAVPEHDSRWGSGWALAATISVLQGDLDEALELGERAAAAAAKHGWIRIRAEALRALSQALSSRGERARAEALTREALTLFEVLGEEERVGVCQNWLGFSAQKRGALDEATAWSEAAMERFVRLGDRPGQADAAWVLGHVALQRGDLGGAAARFEYSRALFSELGQPLKVANVLNDLAEVHRHAGDFERAEADYRASMALSRQVGGGQVVIPHINLGLMLLARERWGAAAAELRAVQAELHRQGRRGYLPYALLGLALAAAGEGDRAAFDGHLSSARDALRGVRADADLRWLLEQLVARASQAGWAVPEILLD